MGPEQVRRKRRLGHDAGEHRRQTRQLRRPVPNRSAAGKLWSSADSLGNSRGRVNYDFVVAAKLGCHASDAR
jgi:hypothetical protein